EQVCFQFTATSSTTEFILTGTTPAYLAVDGLCIRPNSQEEPTNFLGNDTTLCGASTLLLDASVFQGAYLWQDGSTNPNFIVEQSGDYSVQITTGCTVYNDTITVQLTEGAELDLGADTLICDGSSIALSADIPNASYLWSDGSTGSSLVVSESGTYTLQVATDCGILRDTITIESAPPVSIDLGPDLSICPGESLLLTPVSSGAEIVWSNGSTANSIEVQVSGIYWAEVRSSCSSERDSIMVNVVNEINIDLGDDLLLCPGESITLAAEQPNATYDWSTGASGPSITVASAGQYIVEVMNDCAVDLDTIIVESYQTQRLDLGDDLSFCEETDQLTLTVDLPIPATFLWQDGTITNSYLVQEAGLYTVTVTTACETLTDEIEVVSEECEFCKYYLPNAFSPNDDGINDQFIPQTNCDFPQVYSLQIYNRWGGEVFSSSSPEIGWNGEFKGVD
ncbi:MAG: gliding motility-associated C-terminal domain-containing protein, partial [Bacteroidota bacterium]